MVVLDGVLPELYALSIPGLSRTIDQDIENDDIKKDKNEREYNTAEQVSLVEGSQFFESGFHE
jgi:hypothetical protein